MNRGTDASAEDLIERLSRELLAPGSVFRAELREVVARETVSLLNDLAVAWQQMATEAEKRIWPSETRSG